MKFNDSLNLDFNRYRKTNSDTRLKLFLTHPGFRFLVLYRLCNRFGSLNPIGLFARIWYRRARVKFGFQVPHTTKIGGGLFLAHYGGIVINAKVEIGRNCNIAQGVTIGQISSGDKAGCPKIGDRVFFGPYAVVVGNIEIGNDALIGPLAYVNFSVPPNAVVLGNPAKIVSDKGSAGYINFYDSELAETSSSE